MLARMKEIEHFRWLVPSTKLRGKPRLTTYHLSADEAAKLYPEAVPAPGSREVRQVFESRDEANTARGNIGAGIVAAGRGPR